MRLGDLEATFIGRSIMGPGGVAERYSLLPGIEGAQGLTFRCPTFDHDHKVTVWFQNPVNAPAPPPNAAPHERLKRIGETLEELTIEGAINVPGDCYVFVKDGAVEAATA